jgi:FKBP-type peptidyl-prolyl cis-trans isomerase 2
MFEASMSGSQQVTFAVLEDRTNDVLVRLIPALAGKTISVKVKVTDIKDA